MATVTIACSVPGGLVLGYADAPNGQPTVPVVLAGPPSTQASASTPGYGFTAIDSDFWTAWASSVDAATILASGAVWEA